MEMTIDSIINQLGSLRESSADFARSDPDESIWQNDMVACDAAISILSALAEEGITNADTARDLVHDYRALSEQYKAMHLRHEAAERPVHKGGAWHCPACSRWVNPRHSFCPRCGKKLNAERRKPT